MADMNVIIDCSAKGGDGVTVRPLSEAEAANLAHIADETASARTTRDAASAAQVQAGKDIKQLAKQGKPIDAATFARFVGIDVNAPDPAKPAG
jgi:hypothetical protein